MRYRAAFANDFIDDSVGIEENPGPRTEGQCGHFAIVGERYQIWQ